MSKLRTHNLEPITKNAYTLILVGGKGKRLRPLSTDKRPKAFLSITRDKKTMFKMTLDRIKKIMPASHILVAANKVHAKLVIKDFPDVYKRNLILEPVSRNTAPAIGLAAALLKKSNKDAIMVILPADQYVMDEKKYLDTITKGVRFTENNNALMVLALRPTFPSTEFGYVKISNQKPVTSNQSIFKVEKFVEKPDLKTAKKFLKDGRYLWNAGAFVFKASAILKAIKRFAPRIYRQLDELENINKNYIKMPNISIDYAVMERADNIYCVKGTYRWQDIGSFETLEKVLKRESRKFIKKGAKIIKIL